jgi:hypothetical protein
VRLLFAMGEVLHLAGRVAKANAPTACRPARLVGKEESVERNDTSPIHLRIAMATPLSET